eukprot:scaffold291340_cov40-Prasinocladus_malaysianus.AAC.1
MQDPDMPVSAFNVAAKIFKDEGLLAFWRGNLANCIEGFPSKGINFLAYEAFKTAFAQASQKLTTPVMKLTTPDVIICFTMAAPPAAAATI